MYAVARAVEVLESPRVVEVAEEEVAAAHVMPRRRSAVVVAAALAIFIMAVEAVGGGEEGFVGACKLFLWRQATRHSNVCILLATPELPRKNDRESREFSRREVGRCKKVEADEMSNPRGGGE